MSNGARLVEVDDDVHARPGHESAAGGEGDDVAADVVQVGCLSLLGGRACS